MLFPFKKGIGKEDDIMLFSPAFDNALWLILKADGQNRENIYSALVNLPIEFYQKINRSILLYNKKEANYEEYYENSLGEVFYFSLNNDVLTISKFKAQELIFKFQLNARILLDNKNSKIEKWLGNIVLNNLIDRNGNLLRLPSTTYNLKKDNLGYRVLVNQEYYLEKYNTIVRRNYEKILKEKAPTSDLTLKKVNKMVNNPFLKVFNK